MCLLVFVPHCHWVELRCLVVQHLNLTVAGRGYNALSPPNGAARAAGESRPSRGPRSLMRLKGLSVSPYVTL